MLDMFFGTVNLFQERQATTHLLFAGGVFSASALWVSETDVLCHLCYSCLFCQLFDLDPELSVDAIERLLFYSG